MADEQTSTSNPRPETGVSPDQRDGHERTEPQGQAGSEKPLHNRLLWTPTAGQDLTTILFPLNKTGDKA